MGLYDSSLGAMLIATWINAMLWVLEIVQIARVWKMYPKDPLMVKAMMLASLVVDTACTCAACATVYIYCVSEWGNASGLAVQYWTFPLYIITTTASAAIVQSFLIFRFYTLSQNALLPGVFCLLALTAASGGTYTMFTIFLFPTFAERYKNVVSASIWLVATTVTDIALAVGLVWKLRTLSSSFRSTQTILSKLSTTALQSGMVTSAIAIIVLITFLQNNQSNIPVAFNFFLGRVYSHTMLYNLSIRRTVRGTKGSGVHGSHGDFSEGAISLSGIQVSRSLHIDHSLSTVPSSTKPITPTALAHDSYPVDKVAAHDEAFMASPRGNFMVMDS